MDRGSKLLEKLLSEQRRSVLELLDQNHKAIMAAFKEPMSEEVEEDLTAVPRHEHDEDECLAVVAPTTGVPLQRMQSCYSVCSERQVSKNTNNSETRHLLLNLFDLVDADGSGTITLDEVRAALQQVGQRPAQARLLIEKMHAMCIEAGCPMNDGQLCKDDWIRMLESQTHVHTQICKFAAILNERAMQDSVRKAETSSCCIISCDSPARLLWSVICLICVAYVLIIVPYSMAFEVDGAARHFPTEAADLIGKFIDIIFLVDIVISFRTSYIENGVEVRHWRAVTLNYARTWFLFDVASSIPVTFLESMGDGVKLIKFVKVFAMIKALRAAKALRSLSQSRLGELLEHFISENKLRSKVKVLVIILALMCCSHWLGCAMASCGMRYLKELSPGFIDPDSLYLPSFYWAITTISSVGYGDIIPRNDEERIVAMIAMCVGGCFFAVNIGLVTTILMENDRAEAERESRMEVVNHFLEKHTFPRALSRRLRRYLKGYIYHKENSTQEELEVIEKLTLEMRSEVACILIPEEVRVVPIFACAPDFLNGFLLGVLQQVSFGVDEVIVKASTYGEFMYVIIVGHCEKSTPSNSSDGNYAIVRANLYVGESFGEEILLGFAEEYAYTVVARQRSALSKIEKASFLKVMSSFPEQLETMRHAFGKSVWFESPGTARGQASGLASGDVLGL